jgi:trans-2,3-dihydro-3-hydroxyanthranilate isomerase
MQKIAAEMNYSRTTFILSGEEPDGRYDVRIFTSQEEVSFAGHPTLRTAYVIAHEIEAEPIERISLNLEAGRIPVSFGDVCWMRQPSPTFGHAFTSGRLSRVLGVEDVDLDGWFPIQEVSARLPCIVTPLENLEP